MAILVVLGFGGLFCGVNFCQQSFVVGGGVHRVFVLLLDFDLFLQVAGIGLCESALITAPGLQAVEFDVERPGDGEHQQDRGDQKRKGEGTALDRIVGTGCWRTIRHQGPPVQ